MSKIDEVRKDMMNALKAHDMERKEALSMLLSALKSKRIDKRADLTPEEENAVVLKEIKELEETKESAKGRADIVRDCEFKEGVYRAYAPRQMTEDEIRTAAGQTLQKLGVTPPAPGKKGVVMKALMPAVKGRADGALVSRVVTALLAGK